MLLSGLSACLSVCLLGKACSWPKRHLTPPSSFPASPLFPHINPASVRAVFAAASGPPPVQLLEAEVDAQGKPRGASLVLDAWQCLRGQSSSSQLPPTQKQQKQQHLPAPADLAAFCIEVSAWRLEGEEEEGEEEEEKKAANEGRAGKRRRIEAAKPGPVYAEVRTLHIKQTAGKTKQTKPTKKHSAVLLLPNPPFILPFILGTTIRATRHTFSPPPPPPSNRASGPPAPRAS
jgi:hypothetical protein